MSRPSFGERVPSLLVGGGVIAGMTGFADTIAHQRFGVDLGLRDTLPEPLDIPDHGMSWFAGAGLSLLKYDRHLRRSGYVPDLQTTVDTAAQPHERRASIGKVRRAIGSAISAGVLAGAGYVAVGEAGSEVLHTIHAHNQEDISEDQRTQLPLGHFDVVDLAYGVGAATGVAKMRGRKILRLMDQIEPTVPITKEPSERQPSTGRPTPKPSKRYTPPKKKRK